MRRSPALQWVAVFMALLAGLSVRASAQISTFAGGGPPDGSPALEVAVQVGGIALDGSRDVLLSSGNRVLRLTPDGRLQFVAGTGLRGFGGDGGLATEALMSSPQGLAFDPAGNLFVVDGEYERLRRIDAASGVITTVALDVNYIAMEASGDLLISDGRTVQRLDSLTGSATPVAGNGLQGFAGDGGLATHAGLSVNALALDASGNLFISDRVNKRVRRVDAASGIIATVAGNGSSVFSGDGGPATQAGVDSRGIALDAAGNLYIADSVNRRIRRVDASTGLISTIAGTGVAGFSGDGGPALLAQLGFPLALAFDSGGNLWISDSSNLRLRRIDTSGVITSVAGNGTVGFSDASSATETQLYEPHGVLWDPAGFLLIADTYNHAIRRVEPRTGALMTIAGDGIPGHALSGPIGDGSAATGARFLNPVGLALDGAGNLFVSDVSNNRIRRIDAETGVITTVAGSAGSGFAGDDGPALSAYLASPSGIAIDTEGNLFIADSLNRRIRRVDASSGIITTIAGGGNRVSEDDPAKLARLDNPWDVILDQTGGLLISEQGGHRIRRVDLGTGLIRTVVGDGTYGSSGDGGPASAARLAGPAGLGVDAEGNLYIAEGPQRVRRVDAATGLISTVAGTGVAGFSGDGGPPTEARLHGPMDVAVGPDGTVYIADAHNQRIRAVRPPCTDEDDRDCDGVPDVADRCPYVPGDDQDADADGDGRGDACECGDQNGDGANTVEDLLAISLALFNPALASPLCDANNDGRCDVGDIVAANAEIFSPGSTSTCALQPVPGP